MHFFELRKRSNVEKRIRFYTEVMYNWATFMHYVPVKYEVEKKFAGCITVAENRKKMRFLFGVWSFVSMVALVVYLYAVCIFGSFVPFERLYILGSNLVFTAMSACQLCMLFVCNSRDGISLVNAMLHCDYPTVRKAPWSYEITCIAISVTAVVYPFLYYPSIIISVTFLPEVFTRFNFELDNMGRMIAVLFGNKSLANIVVIFLRYATYFHLATSLGHAVVNAMIILHWVCTYFFTTITILERLTESHSADINVARTYVEIKVLLSSFKATFNSITSFIYFILILVDVTLCYVLFRRDQLPIYLVVLNVIAIVGCYVFLYSFVVPVTNSHLLSKSLICTKKKKGSDRGELHLKFWTGMTPLNIQFGGVCASETKEFLLGLFVDVILKSVIDLFLTF